MRQLPVSKPQCGVASRATHDALGLRYKAMYLLGDHPFSVYKLQLAKRYRIYKMVMRQWGESGWVEVGLGRGQGETFPNFILMQGIVPRISS